MKRIFKWAMPAMIVGAFLAIAYLYTGCRNNQPMECCDTESTICVDTILETTQPVDSVIQLNAPESID